MIPRASGALPSAVGASLPRVRVPVLAVASVAALAALPLLGLPPYAMSLVIEILVFAVFAASLDLLVGYTGLVSLGHAAFFGIGGYAMALAARHISAEIWISTTVGLVTSSMLAAAIGWLSIRLSGFYFLMITFAFAQMVFAAAYRWNWLTGGSDGMLVPGPTLLGSPVLDSRVELYYFILGAFLAALFLMRRIVGSPFGRALAGIRERAPRMRAIGYNVRLYKLAIFVIAGVFGALAGMLNGFFTLFISPSDAHWTLSANVLVMVLIGGSGTTAGPIIGAAVVLLLQNWLSSFTDYWSFALGVLFIALITSARQGLVGIARALQRAGRGRRS